MSTRVLVLGAGAIGAFYGAILHRAGASVAVVLRSEYDAVTANGFHIDSPLGDLSFRPSAVYARSEDASAPDYLVVTLKVVEGVDRVAAMRPVVGPNTTIVLIENGIEIEEEIAEAFPNNRLISSLAFVAVSRTAPGRVEHKAYGQLALGDFPAGAGSEVRRFAELLEAGGVRGIVTESVVTERWRKCVWNTAFNPASVLAGGADTLTMLNAPNGEETIRALMQEVCDVAAAAGHPMPADMIDKSIASTYKMPAYKTSMALDYLNNRPMEVEAILGNVVRAGRRHGVAVPHLETVYALAGMLIGNADRK